MITSLVIDIKGISENGRNRMEKCDEDCTCSSSGN